jgi:HAD superfamily phosphoserine phosphatase-like hydrolase
MEATHAMRPGLAVFDIDGTLIRGQTVCELIASQIGKSERMAELERGPKTKPEDLIPAHYEMAGWYLEAGIDRVRLDLDSIGWAPGAERGIAMLRDSGWRLAIASITWKSAVDQIAERLGIEHVLATGLDWSSGRITHVFPDHKAEYMGALCQKLHISPESTVAVGDSGGDIPMLRRAGRGVFVGDNDPRLDHVAHLPGAAIDTVAETILRENT